MNLSMMSQQELVKELLAATPTKATIKLPPCVEDTRTAYGAPEHQGTVVSRKLEVARELLLRNLRTQMTRGPVFDSPHMVRDWLRLRCASLEREVFLVLYLNAHHALIEAVTLFQGTLSQTSVYPREVVKGALTLNAAAVIFAHNHPSGAAEPSRADEHLTQTLKAALALVDVRVIDHCVVAGDQVVSFAERGLL